ncbi:response regulator [uncultured Desulfobacter sp.]|uniref:response regulator n=1 Tax=uncultured Desulfobacter sp. TaxID=240139 RepID=UPI0029F5CC5B|nr:response regulator [uncultured Desulfobacter sp.]
MDKSEKTILIIDDEAHIRRILELKCRNAGFRVVSAKNGVQGLDIIKQENPDVVISDINMPKMNGQELCRLSNPMKATAPFLTIIVTARITSDNEAWVNEMTDTVLMEKPFSPSKILETVDQYLAKGEI